jgi:hypothetical protein
MSGTKEDAKLRDAPRTVGQDFAIEVEAPIKVRQLRELAMWYRGFAERAGNPAIWDARLRTAEELDAEASRIEQRQGGHL